MNTLSASAAHQPHPAGEFPEAGQGPRLFNVEKSPAPRPAQKKILLVDDDAGVREMLGRVLKSENYEVILAKNGAEAATKFMARNPDLVLLDLNMPDHDGWSAFRFMEAAHPLLPVIIITARADQYPQAEQQGVDALMEKPLDLPVLLAAIEKILGEADTARTARITRSDFKTMLLSRQPD